MIDVNYQNASSTYDTLDHPHIIYTIQQNILQQQLHKRTTRRLIIIFDLSSSYPASLYQFPPEQQFPEHNNDRQAIMSDGVCFSFRLFCFFFLTILFFLSCFA